MERYLLIIVGVLLATLLLVSIAIILLRGESELDPDSPEYAVQQYINSMRESDYEAAHRWLSPELQERCPAKTLFEESGSRRDRTEDPRITLRDVETIDQSTFVTVRVSRVNEGLFGPSESSFTRRYEVQKVGGDWRVAAARWPYVSCIVEKPKPPQITG